jgi:type I restriction enzyme S subunit
VSVGPRLKDLGRWSSGGTPPKDREDLWDGELPWVSAKDFDDDRLREPTAFITEEAAENHSRIAQPDAILLIVRGMALAHGLPIAQTPTRVAFNQDLRALSVDPEYVPRFVYYALRGHRARLNAHIDQAAHGTARLINSVMAERIPASSREAEARVADFLDHECKRIDALDRSARALTILNDRRLVSVRHSLLRGYELDTALSEGNWPPGWPQLAHVVDSWHAGGTPDSGDASFWTDEENAPEWIAIGDMSGRRIVGPGSRRVTRDGIAAGRLRLAPPGTLLLAMYASVGEVAELDREAYFNQALIGLHLVDPVKREFVHEWLLLIRPHLPWFTKSSTQPNLSAEIVRHIPIPLLGSDELEPALRTLRSVTTDTARVNKEVAAMVRTLAEYREALITEAVTGKLDVTRLSDPQLDESARAAMEGERPEVLA